MTNFVECPVVDLERINRPDATEEDYRSLGKELVKLLQEIGFLYFVNHGFGEELLRRLDSSAKEFFALDEKVKMKYADVGCRGYAPTNTTVFSEAFVKTDSPDEAPLISELFRESYSSDGREIKDGGLPNIKEVPAFREAFAEFIRISIELTLKLFKAFELGLDIPEGTFKSLHQQLLANDFSKNGSLGRSFCYPPFKSRAEDGMLKYAEHADVDTFTFLFQDNIGGLEVLNKNNIWQPMVPKKNAIVFNTGTCFEIWTAGKMKGTKHRVVVAPHKADREICRRSFAFFTLPDQDVVIKPFHSSAKSEEFQPITFSDHFVKHFIRYADNDIKV